jgi:hypothetical protein
VASRAAVDVPRAALGGGADPGIGPGRHSRSRRQNKGVGCLDPALHGRRGHPLRFSGMATTAFAGSVGQEICRIVRKMASPCRAFLGLDSSPTLWAYKVSAWIKRPDSVPYTDRGAYDAAISYLQYRRFLGSEDQYVSPWTHTYKMRLHDRIIRRVFFEIIESHPASTVGLYLYWKPRQILITFGRLLSPTPIEVWLLMPLATLVLAAAVVATRSVSTAEIRVILWLALAALAFAALPNLWAYADFHTMADLVVSSFLFATFALWAGWALLLIRLRNRFENGQTRNRRSIVPT